MKRKSKSVFNVILLIILVLYVLILGTMVAWVFLNSFKGDFDFDDYPLRLPAKWLFSNYADAMKNLVLRRGAITYDFYGMMLTSVAYSVGCATVSVGVTAITAYTCSQFKYKFSSLIYGVVLFTMIFPIIGSGPSEMQIVSKLGLKNTMYGMYILKANFLGMYFLVFYAGFNGMSKTYSEAAKIDGANNYTIMFRIYFPMVMGTFFTIWLLYFINYWNDYQTPLLYLPDRPTIAYGLFTFTSNGGYSTPLKFCACLIITLPVFILFMIFKDKLMGKISIAGGEKG